MLRTTHESRPSNDLTAGIGSDDFFAAQSVLCRDHRTLIESIADESDRVFHLSRLRGYNAEFAIGELIRLRCSFECHSEFMPSRDSQTVPVKRAGVVLAADKSPYLRNSRQMRSVKAPNGATSYDANPFHAKVVTKTNTGEDARATRALSPLDFHKFLGLTDFF
jgi:hypothetical protein